MTSDEQPTTVTEEQLGRVFAALSDPTRRTILQTLLKDGSASVPSLTGALPISRQGVAKHLATLERAGLAQRLQSDDGPSREVRYRPCPATLLAAIAWLARIGAASDQRLAALTGALEAPAAEPRQTRPERLPELRRLASGDRES